MDKRKVKKWNFFIYIAVTILFGALLTPIIRQIGIDGGVSGLESLTERLGVFGILLVLLIQILQIVVAIVPGEVVEVVSGALYGAWGGLIIDLIGVAIGETIIYFIVDKLGESVVEKVASSKKIQSLKFLKDDKKRNLLLFLLFFIPGTPKDALCYVAPLFKIPYKPFILISTFARIPSIITSNFAGAAFGDGDYMQTILIYVGIAVISIAGIIINQRIMKGKENDGK